MDFALNFLSLSLTHGPWSLRTFCLGSSSRAYSKRPNQQRHWLSTNVRFPSTFAAAAGHPQWEIPFNTQLRSSVMSCRSKYNQWRVMECEAMDGRRMAVAKRRKTFISYFFSLSFGPHCNRDKSRPRKTALHSASTMFTANYILIRKFITNTFSSPSSLTIEIISLLAIATPKKSPHFSSCHPLTELDSSLCRVNIGSPKRDNQLRGDRTFSFILWCCGGDHYLRDFFPSLDRRRKRAEREENYF